MCLGVLEKKFFLSYDKKNYFPLDEFFEVEEIYPSFMTISSNLDSIQLKSRVYKKSKKQFFWGVINYFGKGYILSKNIKVSKFLSVTKKDLFLGKVLSSKICLKVLLKLGF